MYLRSLHIQNMKLLRDFKVSFMRADAPRPWTVFVGENGYCKTTILRAIALAASGRDRANQLAQSVTPSLRDNRKEAGECAFEALFSFLPELSEQRQFPGLGKRITQAPFIRSTFLAKETLLAGSSAYCDANDQPWSQSIPDPLEEARAADLPHWFVAGYGVGRALPDPEATTSRTYIPSLDRLRSLFDTTPLIATDFASRFDAETTRAYAKQLQSAFVEKLLPGVSQVELRGRGGVFDSRLLIESQRFFFRFPDNSELRLPATWLSHGYQSTIAWIADLVGQVWMEAKEPVQLNQIEGLVLIDELDLHLHPTWQRGLVRMLKETFPRVQFVATTHSPMILPGLEADEIFILQQDGRGNVTARQATQEPALMTGGQLYRSFFDIDSLYPTDVGAMENDYVLLASNAFRSDAEDEHMRKLQQELAQKGIGSVFEPVARQTR